MPSFSSYLFQLPRNGTETPRQEPSHLEPSVSCRPALLSQEGKVPCSLDPGQKGHIQIGIAKVPSKCLLKRRMEGERKGGMDEIVSP